MKRKMSSEWKHCATCVYWNGTSRPADSWYHEVEFEDTERGTCFGDGNHGANTKRGEDFCPKWEGRYKK